MSKMTVKLMQPHRPWCGKRVLFSIPGWKHPVDISVYPIHTGGKIDFYGVNWGAFGTVPPDVAYLYAQAIDLAAIHARRLTEKYKGRSRY